MTQHIIPSIFPLAETADHVHSLLTVMADPAKHKLALDELVEHRKAVEERITALNEMAGDTRRLHTDAEAATIVLNNRKAALDAREAEIRTRESEHAADVSEHSKAAMRRREIAVQAREEAVSKREERQAAVDIEHEAKVKKLSHALNEAS